MKLRLLVYGLLFLFIGFLTTLYLVYTNQDRLLEAAQYKLTSMARERWGLKLGMNNSQLNLYRNSVVFKNISLDTDDGSVHLLITRMELVYSLRRLLQGKVYFNRVVMEGPSLETRLPPGKEINLRGFLRTDLLVPVLMVAERVDVEQGTLRVLDPEGKERLRAEGLGMQIKIAGGVIATRVWAEQVGVALASYHEIFRQTFLYGNLQRDGMEIRRLDLVSDAGSLKASGQVSREGSVRGDFELRADLEKFRPSVPGLLALTGTVEGKGRYALSGTGWDLTGRVAVKGLSIAGEPVPDGNAEVEFTPTACTFTGIVMPVAPGSALTGHCDLGWSKEEFHWSFDARASKVPAAEVEYVRKHFPRRILEPLGPLTGTLRFASRAPADPSKWTLSLALGGRVERIFGDETAQVSGEIESSLPGLLTLKNFALAVGPLKAAWAGTYRRDGGASMALIAESSDLALSLAPLGIRGVDGRASFAGDLIGTEETLQMAGVLTAEPVMVRGVSFDRVTGRVRYHDGLLEAEDLTVSKGSGRVVLAGTFPVGEGRFSAALAIDRMEAADGLRLAGQDLPVAGTLSGSVTVVGGTEGLSGKGRITAPVLTVQGQLLRSAAADFSFTPGRVELHAVEAVYRGGRATFQGAWELSGELTGRISGTLPGLETIVPGGFLRGSLDYQGRVSGTWRDPDFSGTVTWKNGRLLDVNQADFILDVEKRSDRVNARGRLLGRFPLDLELDLVTPAILKGTMAFENLDLPTLLSYLPPAATDQLNRSLKPYNVRLTGNAAITVPLARPEAFSGSVDLQQAELNLGTETSRLRAASRLTFSRDGVELGKLVFEGEGSKVTVEGGLSRGNLSLGLTGTLDLGFLADRFPAFSRLDVRPEIS